MNPSLETPDNSAAPLSILCDTENDYTDIYLLNADSSQLINGSSDAAFHRHRQFTVYHSTMDHSRPFDTGGADGESIFQPVLTILPGLQGSDGSACRVIPQVICTVLHGSRNKSQSISDASALKAKLYQAIQEVGEKEGLTNTISHQLVYNNANIVRVLAELESHAELIAKAYARLVTDTPAGQDLPPGRYFDSALYTEPGSPGAFQPNGYALRSFSNSVGLIDSEDKLRMVAYLSFVYNLEEGQDFLIDRETSVASPGYLSLTAAIPDSCWMKIGAEIKAMIIGFGEETSMDRMDTLDRQYYRPDDPIASTFNEDTPLCVPASHVLQAYDVLMKNVAEKIHAHTRTRSFRQTAGRGYNANRVALRPLNICHMGEAQRQYELSKGTVQYAVLGDA